MHLQSPKELGSRVRKGQLEIYYTYLHNGLFFRLWGLMEPPPLILQNRMEDTKLVVTIYYQEGKKKGRWGTSPFMLPWPV